MYQVTLPWSLVLAMTISLTAWGRPTLAVTDREVGEAITRIKQFLYAKQDTQSGSWEFRSQPGGIKRDVVQHGAETAVVTYALLASGESFQNPKLSKAIDFLRELNPTGTYAVSMRAHVWGRLPASRLSMLDRDANWLLQAAEKHPQGLFYYQPDDPTPYTDNGVVQYGVLGLWEASKRGYRIPAQSWKTWLDHFLDSQHDDGNWRYAAHEGQVVGGVGSGNIFDTTGIGDAANAGLAALLIIQQDLYRGRKTPEPKVFNAINKGLDWLDHHFDLATGNSGYNHYYLFGVERIAAASGVRYLNGQDWYTVGAQQIIRDLKQIQGINHDSLQMAFALMFLSRGRYPVWIAKLKVEDIAWNNRPNDLHFLNLHLSDQREGELNWQVIDIDKAQPEDWLMSPVLYLSSGQPIQLDQAQRQRLKRYLDMGGLLVTCAENRSRAFSQSIRDLSRQMYPHYDPKPLAKDDPLCSSWRPRPDGVGLPVHTVSNGARHLILMVDEDWGYPLQADAPSDKASWTFASNLFAYATSRGVPNNRLVSTIESRRDLPSTETLMIGRARYDGNWLPEPAAWDRLSTPFFNRTGITLKPTASGDSDVLDLTQIGHSNLKLIHLSGTEPVNLTEAQRQAIESYTRRGGTLLVETVGGRGGFARHIAGQLEHVYESNAIPVISADPIISGEGLAQGYDNRRSLYRPYEVLQGTTDAAPRLRAFLDDENRPMVIISDDDLSTGLLNTKHWGIRGYQPVTSGQLMTNLVLWCKRQPALTRPTP